MSIKEVVMVSACRTAIAKFSGALKDVPARDLAIAVGKEAAKRAGIEPDIIPGRSTGYPALPPQTRT